MEGGGCLRCRLQHLPRTVMCHLRCHWPVPTQSLVVEDLDGGDKAIAAAAERFDEALLPSAVPSGLAGGCHVLVHGGVADALRRPEVLNQFILGDDAITMRNEVGEHIENLRPKWTGLPAVTEFVQVRVQCIITKDIDHGPPPCPTQGAHPTDARYHAMMRTLVEQAPTSAGTSDAANRTYRSPCARRSRGGSARHSLVSLAGNF